MEKELCVMQIIPNLCIGGAETFVTELALHFPTNARCIVVSLYEPNHTVLEKKLEESNVKIVFLNKKKGMDFHLLKALRKLIKQYKPDVINTHLYSLTYVVLATRFMKNKPLIFHTVHNVANKEATKNKQKLYNWFFHHQHVYPIGISNIIVDSIKERYKLKEVICIENGINYAKFKGDKLYDNRKYDFIHVGRFSYQKNHEMLIKAFSEVVKVRSCHLYLVGQGELMPQMKELVKELDIEDNVTFFGLRSDVDALLKDSKIFILPSHYEGNPLSLLEAMSSGCATIATPVGGVKDVLKDGINGYLCENSINSLAKTMLKCLDNDEKMRKISEYNISYSAKFDIGAVAKKYYDVYETKMNNNKK